MNLAELGLLSYGINAIWLLIALVVLIVLLRLYVQTHMSGFLWLLFAVVVWPCFARVISMLLPMYASRQGLSSSSMALTTLGWSAVETIVGGALLLIALLVLQRQLSGRLFAGQQLAPSVTPVAGMPPYNG